MRFRKFDLNQLVVLDALLTERSVKKAADSLFLSPPATSCALARLRSYFEDDLLVMVGKKMVLTEKADKLAAPVRDLLLRVQAITAINPAFDSSISTRKITIEVSDYVMHVFLARVLERAAVEAPLMQFDLRAAGPHSHADLENGVVDMLIVPEFRRTPRHPSEHVFDDEWSCVTWTGNHNVGLEISLREYLDAFHVAIEWGAGKFSTSDESAAIKLGYLRHRAITVPSFTVVPRLLIGTARLATLQTRLARSLAATEPLRVMPCPMPVPTLKEYVQWHIHKQQDPAIVWLRSVMSEVGSDMSSPAVRARPELLKLVGANKRGTVLLKEATTRGKVSAS